MNQCSVLSAQSQAAEDIIPMERMRKHQGQCEIKGFLVGQLTVAEAPGKALCS